MSSAKEPTWVELLDERTQYLKKEITPVKLLPHLNLPNNEKEKITCDERNDGQEKASMTLLQNLRKRDGANGRKIFEQLVRALRIVGLQQSALLLDPHFKVQSATEVLEDENSFPLGIIGTAAEIRVTIRLLNDETKKYYVKGERDILKLYKDIKSESTLQLRSQLDQVLPVGAAFSAVYQASKDFVPGCKLRVSQTSAADTIWKTYREGSLMTLLKEKLLSGVGPEIRSRLKMHIHIMREDYETACNILNGRNQTDSTDETHQVKHCRIPPVYLNVKSAELRLRPYQEELASPGLEGKNTIVCAPTNSGKTYVALRIARAHLDKYKQEQSDQEGARAKDLKQSFEPKVLFVVNKVNLVLQQKHRFDYYLSKSSCPQPKGYDIADISGANAQDKSLAEVVQENDVIVLTAQILVDALKSRRVSITDFSLLIFDECHHTDKGHPYNEIMLQYLTFTYSTHLAASSRRPQIIGLTASLGVGKATNMADAQEHVLQLCANLDCAMIVTVEQNKVDLEGKVGTCKRYYYEIPDGELDYFDTIIGNVMVKIEGMVPKEPGPNSSPHVNRGSQQYQQWLVGLDQRAVARGSRELITLVEHLQVYNTALAIKQTCRVKDALKYIEDFQETQNRRKFEDVDHKLRGLYEEAKEAYIMEYSSKGEIKNPKLEAVADRLKEQYMKSAEEGENQTAKGILFTATRENTKALKAWLDENSDLAFIKAERLVGTGKGEDGMTQFQQEEIIANFRCGIVNLLISTTVGEEGIDIPDCNFVIRYNVRGNEIASVQSRGRVRDIRGKYEVVAGKESGVIEKENLNIIREAMMEKAIKAVKAMDQDQYKERVLELQRRAICHHQRRERSMKNGKQKTNQGAVKLFCRKCQVFACNADSIRCIKEAHHVVIDQEFQTKSSSRRSKVSRVVSEGVELTGPLHCLDCDTEWGTMLKYKAKEMPCIKANSFAFEFQDEEGLPKRRPYKKWKLVPLTVEDFDLCEAQFDCPRSLGSELDVENQDGNDTTLSKMRGKCPLNDETDVFLGKTTMDSSCSFALEMEHKDGSKMTLLAAKDVKSPLSDTKDGERRLNRFSSFGVELKQKVGMGDKSPLPDAKDVDVGEMRLSCSSDLFQLSLD